MRVNPAERLAFTFVLLNAGATPAHNMQHSAVVRVLPHPLPSNFPFPQLPAERPSRVVLAPRIPMMGWAVADNQFTQAQIIEYLSAPTQGGNRLYIIGQADYIDAFGEPRWTRFCISFLGWRELVPFAQDGKWDEISKRISMPGVGFNFEAANQHNEST